MILSSWLAASLARGQPPVPPDAHAIATQLASPQRPVAAQAMKQIETYLAGAPYPQVWPMAELWPQALLKGRHYQMAADLTLQAIIKTPENTSIVVDALHWRVQALLHLHHPRQALGAARGYFNVCDPAQTGAALLLVAQCLNAAYPNQPQIVQALVRQERAGAAPPKGGKKPKTSAIMLGIRINPTPFADCLKENSAFNDPLSLLARGNLLLVLGHGSAAIHVFQQLREAYGSNPQYDEDIARALKARDGTVGSANAWILALQ